ncbi:MAG TPA: hypothetical protein P5119_03540 [Candidatus Aminicenantes bacterium]|nr:hypothetical protein [Candidatus Aminicenantes bacterium]HRY64396.1 hypothetical protein [Candidatus Aminicenantes bacterium]HRZ71309.1 hypothetical protein [Candidatus Aminicenantes bacterium]
MKNYWKVFLLVLLIIGFIYTGFFWKHLDGTILKYSLLLNLFPGFVAFISLLGNNDKWWYSGLIFLAAVDTQIVQQKLSYPRKVEKYVYAGNQLYAEGLYRQAKNEYDKAFEIDRQNIRVLRNQVLALWQLNEIENAISIQNSVILLDDSIENRFMLAFLHFIKGYGRLYGLSEVPKPSQNITIDISMFMKSRSLVLDKKNFRIYFVLDNSGKIRNVSSRILSAEVERDFDLSKAECQEILSRNKDHKAACGLIAAISFMRGNYDEASMYQKRVVAMQPTFPEVLKLGAIYLAEIREPKLSQEATGKVTIKGVETKVLENIDNVITFLKNTHKDEKQQSVYIDFISNAIDIYMEFFSRGLFVREIEGGQLSFDIEYISRKMRFLSSLMLEVNSDRRDALLFLGEADMLQDKYADAIRNFNKSIEATEPTNYWRYFPGLLKIISEYVLDIGITNKQTLQEIIISRTDGSPYSIKNIVKEIKDKKSFLFLRFLPEGSSSSCMFHMLPRIIPRAKSAS